MKVCPRCQEPCTYLLSIKGSRNTPERGVCVSCYEDYQQEATTFFRLWWYKGDPNIVTETQHETQPGKVPVLDTAPRSGDNLSGRGQDGGPGTL